MAVLLSFSLLEFLSLLASFLSVSASFLLRLALSMRSASIDSTPHFVQVVVILIKKMDPHFLVLQYQIWPPVFGQGGCGPVGL